MASKQNPKPAKGPNPQPPPKVPSVQPYRHPR